MALTIPCLIFSVLPFLSLMWQVCECVLLDWDWESWQASPHSEGRIDSPEHFWSFYDNLSQVNEEVLYANGIEMSFTEVQGINF